MYIGQLEKEKISWKKFSLAGLKLSIPKTKTMASGPLTSWQIDGETVETVRGFIFLGSKITADGDRVLKSRDITLPTKVRLIKAMVFPVVMYGCKSWTIKKLSTKELMFLNCGVREDS